MIAVKSLRESKTLPSKFRAWRRERAGWRVYRHVLFGSALSKHHRTCTNQPRPEAVGRDPGRHHDHRTDQAAALRAAIDRAGGVDPPEDRVSFVELTPAEPDIAPVPDSAGH